MTVPIHRAPTQCPACSAELLTLRLGCPDCGTEVAGTFSGCSYCRLPAEDLAVLEVFLRSRGNMREVQSHLGVSYPTARQRFAELLARLGMDEPAPAQSDAEVLSALAAGKINVEEAQRLLEVPR